MAGKAGKDTFNYAPGESVGYLIRDTFRAFTRVLQAKIADHDVTIGQWYFLRVLWEEDGLTQRELSDRVGMMEPTTTVAISGMEKAGLIRRKKNTSDRRKINVFLTPKAKRLKATLLPYARDVNELAVAGISKKDLAVFRAVIAAMKDNIGGS